VESKRDALKKPRVEWCFPEAGEKGEEQMRKVD
jgi:hypothetical protein